MKSNSPKFMILFNGPPRSGKDTAADAIFENFLESARVKNTTPMDRAIKAMFNMTDDEFLYYREAVKDTPQALFKSLSMREILISMSEDWCKPLMGDDVFGRIVADRFLPDKPLLVCSDSGFEAEAVPYIKKLGADNMLLVRIHRDGCNFSNDSRSYLSLEKYGVPCVDLMNSGTVDDFQNEVVSLVSTHYEGIFKWTLPLTLPGLYEQNQISSTLR